jgi:aspartyl-tRNA(Asn)/glutamyl-tRNA(Gln) amidotransferase subunit B
LWDGAKGEIRPARSKEGSSDYRYFPEPDLPPLVVTDAELAQVRATLPELPAARRARYAALRLSDYDVQELTADVDAGPFFESTLALHGDAKGVANWVNGEVRATLNETGASWLNPPLAPARLAALLDLVRDGVVGNNAAKKIYAELLLSADTPRAIAEREGLIQVRDDNALAGWVDEVLAENPQEAARFSAGEKKLQGLLVGLVMKKSQGRADPKLVNQLLASRAAG